MAYVELKEEARIFWNPKTKDDQIEGKILEIKKNTNFENGGNEYLINDSRVGKIWTKCHKQLCGKMEYHKIKVGEQVKIIFVGIDLPKQKGQNGMARYKVERDQ